LDQHYSAAYRYLANIYNEVKKDCNTASSYYNQYINYSRESEISAKTWYKKGFCENETEQYEDAVMSLKRAITMDSKYAAAYTEIGYAYYTLKRYDEALIELNTSVGLSDISAPNYYMGLCYIAKNQKTKAQEIYQKLVGLNSPDADKLLVKINAMP
jgi:tetratricopeptide (TPR) repeat protein